MPILIELVKHFDVLAVVTEIDKPAGRNREIVSPPVKVFATQYQLPCHQPLSLKKNPRFADQLAALKPELFVVAAYGKIIPQEFLDLPTHGCLNVHPSLLPKYRGASPIQAALLHGDEVTGTTVILMDPGMDTGDIEAQESVEIFDDDSYTELAQKLSLLSADLLINIIPDYINGKITLVVQDDDQVTYSGKVYKEDGKINWQAGAREIANQSRAFNEWPGSYTFFNEKKLDITKCYPAQIEVKRNHKIGEVFLFEGGYYVACGQGFLRLLEVKLEGKRQIGINDFVNGHSVFVSAVLG